MMIEKIKTLFKWCLKHFRIFFQENIFSFYITQSKYVYFLYFVAFPLTV